MAQASTADARTDPRQVHKSPANHVDAARLRLDVRFGARLTFVALLPDSTNSHGESLWLETAEYWFHDQLKSCEAEGQTFAS